MQRYTLFISLLISITIHLAVVFSGLVPSLKKRQQNISRPVIVELNQLSLNDKYVHKYETHRARNNSKLKEEKNNTTQKNKKNNSIISPTKNLSKIDRQQQIKKEINKNQYNNLTVFHPSKSANIIQQNYREHDAGHKLHGARDAQDMIVSSQNLQSLPNSAKLTYLEENFGFPCNMVWQRENGKYKLSLTVRIPFHNIQYQTNGLIDKKHGLQPLLFQEIRNGKVYRSTKFNWEKNTLEFNDNGKNSSAILQNGAQDLLSLSWQLALKGAQINGNTQITNGRKVYNYPIHLGNGAIFDADNGSMRAKIVQAAYDEDKIELWLAPDFANTPIRIIFKKPKEPKLDLQITSININGKDEWQRPDKHMSRREK